MWSFQTVDKVRGIASDFFILKVLKSQYLQDFMALFWYNRGNKNR